MASHQIKAIGEICVKENIVEHDAAQGDTMYEDDRGILWVANCVGVDFSAIGRGY